MGRVRGQRKYSHIREESDAHRLFALHPENDEAFTRSGRQIIEASRLNISLEVWFEQCNTMLNRVHSWAQEQSAHVRACYAVPRGAAIAMFFVPRSETFDFGLADKLADLTLELIRDYNVGIVEAHQVPDQELERFLVSGEAIRIYLDADCPHRPVEA